MTPFDPLKYHVFEYIMENFFWSKCSIFHIFKSIPNLIFSMLSKNRKWCHDLKIAYEVKDQPIVYRIYM